MTGLRVGHGYDVHRLAQGRPLILGVEHLGRGQQSGSFDGIQPDFRLTSFEQTVTLPC